MKHSSPYLFIAAALLCLHFVAGDARAQKKDAPKVEVGVQFSTLELNPPDVFFGPGTETRPGFGGRVTYNLNDHVALEAEGNFFPQKGFFGRTVQGQFGVKAGKRFEKFGVFAKARPGFVSFGQFPVLRRGTSIFVFDSTLERKTYFSTDVGGVLEFYPSRRVVARFDAGDTIIRYGQRLDFVTSPICCGLAEQPAANKHNLQLSAGVSFRFLDGGDKQSAPASSTGGSRRRDVPTVEVGIQYSSLSIDPPDEFVFGGSPIALSTQVRDRSTSPEVSASVPPFTAKQVLFTSDAVGGRGHFTEPAVGGRLTVNLNRNVAIETVANFFTKENISGSRIGGRGIQGLLGVKIGRRFDSFGIFAKARPGFISYSDVEQLRGQRTIVNFRGEQVVIGIFGPKRKTYFNADVGGVLEFYPSRRVVARFDAGDTIIRYTTAHIPVFDPIHFVNGAIGELPAETRHNFQFSAGIGYRF